MSPEDTPIFTLPKQPSRIEVTPAKWVKRFQPVADAYVDEGDPANPHNTEVLSVQSNIGNNRRIYLEFNVATELGAGQPGGISPNEISEVWLALYCKNISQFMGTPWDIPEYDLKTNSNGDNFYLPSVPVKVEARTVSEDWDEATITWDNQPWKDPTDGDTIAAGEWPWEDNHVIKENEVWFTYEVTGWVKEQFSAGNDVSFLLKATYENSSQERYANFTSRESNGWRATDENETGGDSNKATGHPPYVKPYLAVFYENGDRPGPSVYDNWGALIEEGSVRFDSSNYQYPDTSFTFESGAIFQQLYSVAYTLLIADPGVVVGERLDGDAYQDNIAIYVNRYRIINRDQITTAADVKLKVTVTENFDNSLYPTTGPDNWTITSDGPMRHLENVMITFRTDFEWAWKYYFRDLTVRWNASASKGGLQWWANYYGTDEDGDSYWSNNVVEFMAKLYVDRNERLYIWGRVEDASVADIFYYDRTYDVEVEIVI
jgi:hypothetical protein